MKEHERCRASIARIVILSERGCARTVQAHRAYSPVGTHTTEHGRAFVQTCPGIVLAGTNLCNHADVGLSQMHDSSKSPCRDPGFQAGVDRNIVIVDRDCFRSLAEHLLDAVYAGKGWRDENTTGGKPATDFSNRGSALIAFFHIW